MVHKVGKFIGVRMQGIPWFVKEGGYLIAASVLGLFIHFAYISSYPAAPTARVTIVIPHGTSVMGIAGRLAARGVIADPGKLMIFAKLGRVEGRLKAGKYEFLTGSSEWSVVRRLVSGGILVDRVTVPEGLTVRETAHLLEREAGVTKEEILELASDSLVAYELGVEANGLEGYLFPDTYSMYWGTRPRRVIQMLVHRFFEIFNDSLSQRATELGFSIHQIVILASMIEKEAQVDEERFLISSVLHYRLELEWPLQCDATIQYALPERKEQLTYDDLEFDSPYNTYIHQGLPPGPICSPGERSIIAALYPADTDYLYYVARGDGTHEFSRTSTDHQRAKLRAKRGGNHNR
jgi:UPF0755 protein